MLDDSVGVMELTLQILRELSIMSSLDSSNFRSWNFSALYALTTLSPVRCSSA